MIKKILLAAVCALAISPAFAQETETKEVVEYGSKRQVETNGFWSNWYVGVGGGAQMFFSDHDKQCKFLDRITPAAEVFVGKWFTPTLGLRLLASGWQVKGATQVYPDVANGGSHATGVEVPGKGGSPDYLQVQKFYTANFHADVMINFSTLFCGYKEDRIWNCSPYLGIGWGCVFESPKAHEIGANVGIYNAFRVCDPLDINLDIRGSYFNDRFDGEVGGRYGEGILSVTLGVTYKFEKRNWDRSKTVTRYQTVGKDAMDAARNDLEKAAAENARLQKELADTKDALANTKETVVMMKAVASNIVVFKFDDATLSNEARVSLGMLAESIKNADSNLQYSITGYADKFTGEAERNSKLSEERANNVLKCLVEEFGVSEKQLRIDYKGGVDNMFYDDPRMSRSVIIRVIEE